MYLADSSDGSRDVAWPNRYGGAAWWALTGVNLLGAVAALGWGLAGNKAAFVSVAALALWAPHNYAMARRAMKAGHR